MQGILSKVDVILPSPDTVERSEWLFAGLCGIRVYGWNGAAGAGLWQSEINIANANFSSAIFGVTGATGNNQIGPEPGHR